MTQREDPKDQASIAMAQAMLATRHGPGGMFSGARILDFQRGWAIPPFRHGEAVHYLRIVGAHLVGACGVSFPLPYVRGMDGIVVFGQGGFRRCRKCQRAVDRKACA